MTRVLYIGGTGEISYACVEESVRLGHHVSVFNRGKCTESPPPGVEQIIGDLHDDTAYASLAKRDFDVVCQFLAYETPTVQRDIDVFAGHCEQYVFVSSAAVHRKPADSYVVTEDTEMGNQFWEYGRNKEACERLLHHAHASGLLPVTTVRPGHTFRTRLPAAVLDSDHQAWRIVNGKPIILHDDGETLWTVTHSSDFARAFARLCNNADAHGETYLIADNSGHSWRTIIDGVGDVLGATPDVCHVPTDLLVQYRAQWTGPLRGDKSSSTVFDTTKISSALPGWRCETALLHGLELASTYATSRLTAGYAPDPSLDRLVDRIVDEQTTLGSPM